MNKKRIALLSLIATTVALGAFVSCGKGTDGSVGKDNDKNIVNQNPQCVHTYSDVTVGLQAGCTFAGYSYKVCRNCGDKEYTVLAPLGHAWDDGTVVFTPTCVKNGYMYYTCKTCGETKSQGLDATGVHAFKDGECKDCGLSQVVYIDRHYNGDYGYRYLATLTNGEGLCAFYDDMAKAVTSFHNDREVDAQNVGGDYVLQKLNYAKYGISHDDALSVWKTYTDDKPLYYWLAKRSTCDDTELTLFVEDEYADGAVRTAYNDKLYKIIDEYAGLAKNESAYTVALAYHDKIIEAIDYAYDYNNKPQTAAWAHNITGVLDGKGAVCDGYARTFQLLLNARGIQNVLVTGIGGSEKHAWNLVQLDDEKWYWYDLTFDDTPKYYWGISHDYFCATDKSFTEYHTVVNGAAEEFLYKLPERAEKPYDGDEVIFYDTYTADGAEYTVVGYDTVSVSSIDVRGEFVIPSTVNYRGRDYTVVSIMKYENGQEKNYLDVPSDKVTALHISATVKYIDDGALSGSGMEAITVDENNPLFSSKNGVLFTKNKFVLISYPQANKLKAFVIPDETEVIAYHAFTWFYTKNLEKLTIGKNVQYVGMANWGQGYHDDRINFNFINGQWEIIKLALSGAKQLIVDEQNPYFVIKDDMLFDKELTRLYAGLPNIKTAVVPETVDYIDVDAFAYCRKLVSAKLPNEVFELPDIFTECTSLTEVVLPSNITAIDSYMFFNCSALTSVDIPASVERIESSAFCGCSSLEKIILPDGLKYLDYAAFGLCDKLTEIVVPKNVEYVGSPHDIHWSLPKLYYFGTVEDWENVEKEFAYFEDSYSHIKPVTVYFYSKERPATKGNYWHYVGGTPVAW